MVIGRRLFRILHDRVGKMVQFSTSCARISHDIKTDVVQDKIEECWKKIEKQCQEYRPPIRKEGWKVVRVFISSTFLDFFNEREILVKKVFPELRSWCIERQIDLIECDMRWGIPKNPNRDLIDICLKILDTCHNETDGQPFFLGLIGNRYGWIPKENDISKEIRQKYNWVDNTSITFMEILHGAYKCKSQNAAFFIRTDDFIKSLPVKSVQQFEDPENLNQQQLIELKKKLKQRFPEQVYEYSCRVVDDHKGPEFVKLSELETFCKQTTEFFKNAIIRMYGDQKKIESEEQRERDIQAKFIDYKSKSVIGQVHLLKTLKSYLKGEPHTVDTSSELSTPFFRNLKFWCKSCSEFEKDNMIMCLTEHPGYGKTTLLSKIVVDMEKEGYDIFYHFVGCSATSKNTEFLYRRLINALEDKVKGLAGIDTSKCLENMTLPDMIERMRDLLPILREQKTKLLIVIDGVNELSYFDSDHHMSWLPPRFPGNIKCIVSSADNHQLTIDRLTEHACFHCKFERMSKEDSKLMIIDRLQKFNKKLNNDQLTRIIDRPCAANPLWIKLMTEELRVYGNFKELDEKIDKISDSIEKLMEERINTLIEGDDTGLVEKTLCLLVCSTGPIMTKDLCNMLGDIEKKEEVDFLKWTQIRTALEPYIIKGIGIPESISFYHSEIHKCARQQLESKKDSKIESAKKILALYYTKWCSDPRI